MLPSPLRALRAALLLVLLAATPATASAATPPNTDPGPDDFPAVVRENDVPIVMRDGVRLFADVLRPAGADGKAAPGRFPTIVTMTPYNKTNGLGGGDELFVRHGYVHVVVDVRGTGQSEGTWESWGEPERRDYPEIIEWAAHQPWSNGRTASYGASYLAITGLLGAAQHPPSLKALFPIVPVEDDYRDITWLGGNLSAGFVPLWLGLVTALGVLPPSYAATDPAQAAKTLAQRGTNGLRFQVSTPTDALAGGDNAYDGPFYQQRSPGHYVRDIRIPTFVVAGWYDIFQRGAPRLYERLPLSDRRKKLLVGPWYHTTAGDGLTGRDGTPPPLDHLALAWFDRWLKGERNGMERFANVTHYEIGTGRWTTSRSWPPRGIRWTRLYLDRARSGSAQSINDGTLTAAAPQADQVTKGRPDLPTSACSRSLWQWTAGLARVPGCDTDNRTQELNAFTWTTPALDRPLHLSGPIGLTLRGASNTSDAFWTATLTDVAPDGRSTQITAGWLRSALRALDRRRTRFTRAGDAVVPYHPFTKESERPVAPGEVVTLNIEIFNTNAVIKPGHRLRLTVSGGDMPHRIPTLPTLQRSAGQVTDVHTGPRRPSFLTLPVVQG